MVFRVIVQSIIIICFNSIIFNQTNQNQSSYFEIGLLEYEPGDWNSDQTALAELLKFIKKNTNIPIINIERDIELKMKIGSNKFFKPNIFI